MMTPTPSTALVRSNSLNDLAARIRTEHEAVSSFARQTLQHAINAGELLLAAKSLVDHGDWGDWLHDNCAVSQRTAQSYMRLAHNRAAIEANAQATAYLPTIEEALQGLAKSRPSIEIEADRAIVRNAAAYLPDKGQARIGIVFTASGTFEIFGIVESEHPGYYHLTHIEPLSGEDAGAIASSARKPVRADGIRWFLENMTRFPARLDEVEWRDCPSSDFPFLQLWRVAS